MNDTRRTVKSLFYWWIVVNKTTKNETKEQKNGWFFSMILNTLGVSLLENMLIGKWKKAKITGQGVIRAGEGKIREGQDF